MRLAGLLFLFAATAIAQVGDGLITSATRTVNIAPDQAEFITVVTTGLEAAQSDVIQAFRKMGIQNLTVAAVATGPNTNVYPQPESSVAYYGITFTVAPDALKDFSKRLDSMKAAPPDPIQTVQFSAVLTASPAAVQSAHQAVLPQLLSDARTQAQALAAAAALKVGAIQGLSESSYAAQGISYGFFIPSVLSSSFSSGASSGNTLYNFYASVKFAVQ
jgi:uncharacterized protein YggE